MRCYYTYRFSSNKCPGVRALFKFGDLRWNTYRRAALEKRRHLFQSKSNHSNETSTL